MLSLPLGILLVLFVLLNDSFLLLLSLLLPKTGLLMSLHSIHIEEPPTLHTALSGNLPLLRQITLNWPLLSERPSLLLDPS